MEARLPHHPLSDRLKNQAVSRTMSDGRPASGSAHWPSVTPSCQRPVPVRRVAHLLAEGLPESGHGGGGEGSAGNAAHHHRLAAGTGAVGPQGGQLTQLAAGQVGFGAAAVDRVFPVGGLLPASKHPGQTGSSPAVSWCTSAAADG